jgi:hypothetical protein
MKHLIHPAIALQLAAILVVFPGLLDAQTIRVEPDHRISAPIAFFDDADTVSPGVLSLSSDFSYGSVEPGHDTSFPGGYFSLGLVNRMDVSGGTSYVQSVFEGDAVNGIGDTYVGLKWVAITEGERRPAVAVKPSLEVLGEPSVHDNPLAPARANFLVPVMVQKSFEQFRVYYTTGYLTRGIFFHALALELDRWSRVIPTVVVSHGRLTKDLDFISELHLNRSRSDVLVGAGVPLSPNWGVYGNVSRSFGRSDQNTLRYQISAGISYTVRVWDTQ